METEQLTRAAMHHNNPPLEERLVMEFDSNLREHDFDIIARIEELEEKARNAEPCYDTETAGRYGDAVKAAVAARRLIDAERETLNRPILNAQRALKGRADLYGDRLNIAEKRIRAHLDAFTDREKQKRLAEERERQRLIDEANARAAREAEAERQRLQAIADAVAAQERDRMQAIEDARAAAEAREAKPIEVVAETVHIEVLPIAEVSAAPIYDAVRSDRGVLISEQETWHVEVENIRLVPDLYLKNPAVIEALRKVIAPSVRGKTGLREIKGCRIFPTTKASVR